MTAPDSPDDFVFTPVPVRERHDGWTAARQRAFLRALAELGGVAKACRAVGKSPRSAYALRKLAGADSFAAAWDAALQEGQDRLFDRALARAQHGYLRPVLRRGEIVGFTHAHDNRLLHAVATGQPLPPFPR